MSGGGPETSVPSSPLPMSPTDIVVGFPLGHVENPSPFSDRGVLTPRAAMEEVVLSALKRPPCIVGFSGGRDSSAVLAVAAEVARREGLPDPIPVTRVFPGVPEADESQWQELVIRQVGISDWVRESITDEMDVVGPLATGRLQQHGILWSPLLHGDDFFLRHAVGGSVLDGEGGDDICDPSPHRITPLSRMLRRRRSSRKDLRIAAGVLAPGMLRGNRAARRGLRAPQPWLRPAGQELVAQGWRPHVSVQPLDTRRGIMLVLKRRAVVDLQRNRRFFASKQGTRFISPFLEPDVAQAFASEAGRLGFRNRAEALALVCEDLLPADILERRSKAEFNATFFNRHTREFAEQWTGTGVDHHLVDAQVLKETWLGSNHNALSACLLQSAWLGTVQEGCRTTSDG